MAQATTPVRILVVDDMAVYREPITEVLCHHGYDAHGFANGAQAITAVRDRMPDLILLDVTMPELDGPAFVKALRSLTGGDAVPVIMLTAGANRPQVKELISYGVHDFMLKSNFSLASMVAKIESVLAGGGRPTTTTTAATTGHLAVIEPRLEALTQHGSVLSKEQVHQAFVAGKDLIEEFSPTLALVLRLLGDPSTEIEDIIKAVGSDHALSLKLVKIANSAAYAAGPQRVTTLRAAVMRIGTNRIGEVLTSLGLIDHFLDRDPLAGLETGQFWEHSIGVATIASMLATAVRHPNAERLFVAGVLHDIGRLIVGYAHPERYAEVVAVAASHRVTLDAAERQTMPYDHAALGGALVNHWGYGEGVGKAIAAHHKAGDREQAALIIDLADRLAHGLLIGASLGDRLAPIASLIERLGVGSQKLAQIIEEAPAACLDLKLALLSSVAKNQWRQFDQALFADAVNHLRPVVFATTAVGDPIRLWCQRLTALARSSSPNLCVLHPAQGGSARLLAELQAWEREQGIAEPLPTVIAAGAEVPVAELPAESGRRSVVIRTPVAMDDLLAAMRQVVGGE